MKRPEDSRSLLADKFLLFIYIHFIYLFSFPLRHTQHTHRNCSSLIYGLDLLLLFHHFLLIPSPLTLEPQQEGEKNGEEEGEEDGCVVLERVVGGREEGFVLLCLLGKGPCTV